MSGYQSRSNHLWFQTLHVIPFFNLHCCSANWLRDIYKKTFTPLRPCNIFNLQQDNFAIISAEF